MCERSAQPGLDLCKHCEKKFLTIINPCTKCGIPIADPSLKECGNCIINKSNFRLTVAPYIYKEPISHLIHGFKYHDNHLFGSILGKLLAIKVNNYYVKHVARCDWPVAVIPVPLHPIRLFQRGFNQSNILAHYICKTLKIPMQDCITRKLATKPQNGLSQKQREKNVKDAFSTNTSFKNKNIAIIDDVITTGSTSHSLYKTLKINQAKNIDRLAIAKTVF